MLLLLSVKKNSVRNTIRVPNSLDPDQDQYYVGPDLGANCLQRLSAEKKVAASFCCCLLKTIFQGHYQSVK